MVTYADNNGIVDAVSALALTAPIRPKLGVEASAQMIRGG